MEWAIGQEGMIVEVKRGRRKRGWKICNFQEREEKYKRVGMGHVSQRKQAVGQKSQSNYI